MHRQGSTPQSLLQTTEVLTVTVTVMQETCRTSAVQQQWHEDQDMLSTAITW